MVYFVLLKAGLSVEADANDVFDLIMKYRRKTDELVQVWLSNNRENCIDPVVSANALYFAYLIGRGHELLKTQRWLINLLNSNEYKHLLIYYLSPEIFLYFMSRMIEFPEVFALIQKDLKNALIQRIGKTDYIVDIALRVYLSALFGINNIVDVWSVINTQNEDGSWNAEALFKYSKREIYFGSKEYTTAICVASLYKVLNT